MSRGNRQMQLALLLSSLLIVTGNTAFAEMGDESRAGDGPWGRRLAYSTYFGGDRDEYFGSIHHTDAGEIVVCGYTLSDDIHITPGVVFPDHIGRADVYVSKFDQGGQLVFSTYIGGTGTDVPLGIITDANGDIYITGTTTSDDWPVTEGAYQSTRSGLIDAFACKLSSDGSSLLSSTYLGGSNDDRPDAIGLGADGSIIITGNTRSIDYPIVSPHTGFNGGEWDVFLTTIKSDYSSLLVSRYIGGTDSDTARDMKVGQDGSIYISGQTSSSDFPDTNEGAYRPASGSSHGFVLKLRADGSTIDYSTVMGGTYHDDCESLVPSASGGCHVVGETRSNDFPLVFEGGHTVSGESDIFISSLDGSGQVLHTTLIGGSGSDTCLDVDTDGLGNLYLAGRTDSQDIKTSDLAVQYWYGGGDREGLCIVYNTTREHADYITYLGGQGSDLPSEVSTDGQGSAWIVGWTDSADFPVTPDGIQPELNGTAYDAFITRIITDTIPPEIEYIQEVYSWPRGAVLYLPVNVSDNIGETELYLVYRFGDGGPVNKSFNSSGFLLIPQQPEGDLVFHFSAVDAAGNWATTEDYSVVLINTPPGIQMLPTWHVDEGTDATYPLYQYVSDLNGDPVTITCSDPNVTIDQDNLTLHVRHDIHVPDRQVWVTASDGEDESTVPLTIHVVNVNDAPVIISIQPANGSKFKEGRTITFTVSATDEDGDELIFIWGSDGVTWGNEATIEYSRLKPGNRVINVTVSDGTDATREQFTITIKEEDSPGFGLFVALAAVVLVGLVVRRKY